MHILFQPPFVTLLMVAAAGFSHWLFGPWRIILRNPILGGALAVLGLFFMMWARIHFTSRKTTLFVGKPASHLVCAGPFRFSRNPMYVGVIVSLSGIALWVGTLPMYAAALGAFMFFNFFYIPREERMLRELFGDRYLAYTTKVRRWL